jgi:hypothetical protein
MRLLLSAPNSLSIAIMNLLLSIQDSLFSTWIRESDWALFSLLIVHTLGMAFLVGTSISMMLRVLGVATQVPLNLMVRFVPLTTCGLVTVILSGVLLVLGYPAKALTNPVFYFKLVVLAIAFALTRHVMQTASFDSNDHVQPTLARTKVVAALCFLLWLVGTTAGKFLAYTNTMLLVY